MWLILSRTRNQQFLVVYKRRNGKFQRCALSFYSARLRHLANRWRYYYILRVGVLLKFVDTWFWLKRNSDCRHCVRLCGYNSCICRNKKLSWQIRLTLRRVHVMTVALEKQYLLYILNVCVCSCLTFRHANRIFSASYYVILCVLSACTTCFSTLSRKRLDFRGEKLLSIKCVFWLLYNFRQKYFSFWEEFIQILSWVAGPSGRAVFGRSPAEIVGSNPTRGMDICLLWVLCVVR